MMGFLARLPLLPLLIGISALAMLIPALVAVTEEEYRIARSFFYSALVFLTLTMVAGIALQGARREASERGYLIGLIAAYLVLPAIMALPLSEAIGNTRYFNSYFEMLSCLTTTGATVYEPDRLTDALHLWRSLGGWLGGLLAWTTAAAVMAPLSLGGFEVSAEIPRDSMTATPGQMQAATPGHRMRRTVAHLAPVYIALTALLWLLQVLTGEEDLSALSHAMAVLSTSGISPHGTLDASPGGFLSELTIFVFFVFALTRHSFSGRLSAELPRRLFEDRELRLAVYVVGTLTALLFLRHWIGALDVAGSGGPLDALGALWGALFTTMSFLTTTGFVSDFWGASRGWSGLHTPGLILLALALMGGGAATTAGGIKLIRVYALSKHGLRELGKLTFPNSVASGGRMGRRIRREGAYIAWVFFMLFILSLSAIMLALSLTGLEFEESFVLAAAGLTTTGPLAAVGGEVPIVYALLTDPAKIVFMGAMILGRLETLALIALLNPAFWRM